MWRDQAANVTGAALVGIAGLAWVGVVVQGMVMQPGTAERSSVSLSGAAVFLAAWAVMMAAMMLPSATPMIALYEKLSREPSRGEHHVVPTALFAAVYLAIWVGLGAIAYVAGVALNALADASQIVSESLPYAVAAVLVAAGIYQFTALKQSCLRNCRTPLSFLMARWQRGYAGALKLAAAHAAYCVGCCAALMVVLVAAGAMSLLWVLLIAAIVFLEKILPGGERVARLVGVGFVALGIAVALDPDLAAILRGGSISQQM
jgi:predicted metal-binding membrane protein